MQLHPADFLKRLPLPATDRWPEGVFDIEAFERGGLTLELFAPRGIDHQTAHAQDELYFVIAGNATLDIDGGEHSCAPGDALFVPALVKHRFVRISDDFATWAVFWGEVRR
ncbi:MAG TPA: cupin domain-containing protein [Xanthomonadaceae bacterium]|jgi:mannose-6-phosphate isomerase-like protein (cupin superfamily)|nr:cupin domain-containing protein [Xanthomonadaceae bacterium]